MLEMFTPFQFTTVCVAARNWISETSKLCSAKPKKWAEARRLRPKYYEDGLLRFFAEVLFKNDSRDLSLNMIRID